MLDLDIRKCAQFHADQHVIKMILESAQMLCTVLNKYDIPAPYKPTHFDHPCTLWAGASLTNWKWLKTLALALNEEYKYRFGKSRDHQSALVICELPIPPIQDKGLTEFAQTMPEKYRVPGDAVKAYRKFYIGEKYRFATWKKRGVPKWFKENL